MFGLLTAPIRVVESVTRAARETASSAVSDFGNRASETASAVDVRGQLSVLQHIIQSGMLDPNGPLDRMLQRGGLLERLAHEDGVLERIIEHDGPLDRLLEREGLLSKMTERDTLERLIALTDTLDRLGPALDRIGPALDALNTRIATLQELVAPGGAVGDFVARFPLRRRKSSGSASSPEAGPEEA
ncbi:hypothetical protein [Hoyosella altamirensis]|uniref:Uncharacterized protein n=1 Tax=Hoyosella altamirensis TaxID=616997 RepID=A0A839RUE2_9ACTN|nr:hypothetical protein [Hoyosella altamirensis]MBB3039513.1 hypothetical protein [Hoyosella altamirensis]